MPTGVRSTFPGTNGGLLQSSHESVKEDIPAMEMSDEIDATDLLMARQVGDKKRNPDCAAQISYEVADTRDLVIVLLAHTDVRKRADGNKDQGNADDLENPHPDYSAEVNVERDAHHPEHAHRSQ